MQNWILSWTAKRYIWIKNKTGEKIYLSPPSWDCWWYWWFWYLWNNNCHYHLNSLYINKNLHDWLKEHFKDLQIKEEKIWTFCDLIVSAYKLKEVAALYHLWWANYTKNPLSFILKRKEECKKINEEILPSIFLEIEKCFN